MTEHVSREHGSGWWGRWGWAVVLGAVVGKNLFRSLGTDRSRRRPPPARPSAGGSAPPRRILVVEDDASVQMVLKMVLEVEGYEVSVAPNLDSARRTLGGKPFDLLILDLNLPDGNGIDLLGHLRDELASAMPVLVLSGFKQEDAVVRALESGADDYLTKPFGPRELVARLHLRMAN